MDEYVATFKDDGSGDYRIYLPQSMTGWDLAALDSVIKGIRKFQKPGVDSLKKAAKMRPKPL